MVVGVGVLGEVDKKAKILKKRLLLPLFDY